MKTYKKDIYYVLQFKCLYFKFINYVKLIVFKYYIKIFMIWKSCLDLSFKKITSFNIYIYIYIYISCNLIIIGN